MFDVFYIGRPTGLFDHERPAKDIADAIDQSRTRFLWILSYLADYKDFDFLWEPPPWQAHQRHAWASQWQKDSGTYLVPRSGYQDTNYHTQQIPMTVNMDLWSNADGIENFDFSWHPDFTDPPFVYEFGTQWQKTGGPIYSMPGATQVKYVSQSGSVVQARARHVYVIDHLDGHADVTAEQVPWPIERTMRFFDNYKDTLTRLCNSIPEDQEFVWIVSSLCDYSNFNFSWHPESWQNHMLHVFASGEEKFGDTFFMHVPTFRSKIKDFELLDWYDLNFVSGFSVPRRAMPVIRHDHDSQVDAVRSASWSGPFALFARHHFNHVKIPTVSVWRSQTRAIVPLDRGGETVIVPRDSVPVICTQLYDYAYIDRSHCTGTVQPIDIVFISNGEYGAEHHWDLLCDHGRKIPNRLHRVDRVNGRVACYQAAARASKTDWFFAVFAKLQVNDDFDWSWQPDRMQQAKHYIFHALNPVNGLVYGHQAMIAYNRRLVLEHTGSGLDFTLDQPHEVVPIISGTAYYDNDPWTCWRTAFREALKLRHSLPDVENEYRLDEWLNKGEGVNGHWSMQGSRDAVEYYDRVNGDFDELRRSYEWSWLASYAIVLHPELFTQSKT
jgi:hypothetical protein